MIERLRPKPLLQSVNWRMLIAPLALIVVALAIWWLAACAAKSTSVLTPGTVQITRERYEPIPGDGVALVERTSGTATGPALRQSGDKIDSSFASSAPELSIEPGLSGKSGDTKTSGTLSAMAKSSSGVLYVLGGLCIVGGVLLFTLAHMPIAGVSVAGSGGALIAAGILADSYPWVVPLGLLALAGIGGYFVYTAWQRGNLREALVSVAKAVEDAGQHGEAVKARVKAFAGGHADAVSKTIKNVKRKERVFETAHKPVGTSAANGIGNPAAGQGSPS